MSFETSHRRRSAPPRISQQR